MRLRDLVPIALCLHVQVASAQATADALFAAIRAQDTPAVERLLGANPALASAVNDAGRSAVMMALLIVKDQSFLPPSRNPTLQALLRHHPTLTFFESCATGDVDAVQHALARDPTLANGWHPMGLSALHFAAFSGNVAVTELLLDSGAQIDARARNQFYNTPLQVALLPGNEATARLLLERGADPLVRAERGFAPLHEAAFLGRRDLVDLLLDKGADIDSRANDGRNAITEALRGGHPELADYLRARGAKGVEITADLTKVPE
jgi:ankyrin repeat protein